MTTRFRLAELLQRAQMTQTDLHYKSGVAYSTINNILHNKARQVSLETLDALATALECAPGDLLEQDPKPKRRR